MRSAFGLAVIAGLCYLSNRSSATAPTCSCGNPAISLVQNDASYGSKILSSPGFANNKSCLNLNCVYHISAASRSKISAGFIQFSSEYTYDYLRLYDGPSAGSPMIEACTGEACSNITTTGPALTIVYHTDLSDPAGFHSRFQIALAAVSPPTKPTPTLSPSLHSCAQFSKLGLLSIFRQNILGVFDNQNQVDDETAAGYPTHPFALHISGDVTAKVTGAPKDLRGFFVLEESYYTYPGQSTIPSPFLFRFDVESASQCVRLTSYSLRGVPNDKLKNNNSALVIPYSALSVSSFVPPTLYSFDPLANSFHLRSETWLGPKGKSTKFVLDETIGARQLRVLEEYVRTNGSVAPYATPLLYQRTINGYQDLVQALQQGYQVRMSSTYAKCSPAPANAIGGDDLHDFSISDPGQPSSNVQFYRAKFIRNYQGSGPPYVYDFVSTTVYPSRKVTFFASDIYPDSFKPVYEETFDCHIYDHVTGNGSTRFRAIPGTAAPLQLHSYAAIKNALIQGRTLRYVRDLSKCSAVNSNGSLFHTSSVSGGVVETFEEFNDPRIASYDYFGFNQQNLYDNRGGAIPGSRYLWHYVPADVLFNGTVTWTDSFVDQNGGYKATLGFTFGCSLSGPSPGTRFYIAEAQG